MICDWPTDEGIWMGNLPGGLGWFPLEVRALVDDLPSLAQLIVEARDPARIKDRKILCYIAQWPESKDRWPFTFKSCHPVKEWRRPTDEEMTKARHFYGMNETQGK